MITEAGWIAIAIGAVVGVLVVYVLVKMVRREEPNLMDIDGLETNGEADLMPREMAVPSFEQLHEAAKNLPNGAEFPGDKKTEVPF